MYRLLDGSETPKDGDHWWYQEEPVIGGYWTPCIGPYVHIDPDKVPVRRKIEDAKGKS